MSRTDPLWLEDVEARERFDVEVVEAVAVETFVARYRGANNEPSRRALVARWRLIADADREAFRRKARGILMGLSEAGYYAAPRRKYA